MPAWVCPGAQQLGSTQQLPANSQLTPNVERVHVCLVSIDFTKQKKMLSIPPSGFGTLYL